MKGGQTYTWSEHRGGAVFSVRVEFPDEYELRDDFQAPDFAGVIAAAGSEFRKFVEVSTMPVPDAEVEGYWECGAIARMGTPESPPELCETEVQKFGTHCKLHGGEGPW